LRYEVLQRDGFRCVMCGRSPGKEAGVMLHVDHIRPWSAGGETVKENLQTLCERCNLGKGALVAR
jgi:5-methylcytosine-specific restriction endonuclease McrA